jgi:putative Holliday junction resolvase
MDETLSTRESQTLFYSQRVRKSVQFTDIKDELAAQLILQTWLSHTQPRATE